MLSHKKICILIICVSGSLRAADLAEALCTAGKVLSIGWQAYVSQRQREEMAQQAVQAFKDQVQREREREYDRPTSQQQSRRKARQEKSGNKLTEDRVSLEQLHARNQALKRNQYNTCICKSCSCTCSTPCSTPGSKL